MAKSVHGKKGGLLRGFFLGTSRPRRGVDNGWFPTRDRTEPSGKRQDDSHGFPAGGKPGRRKGDKK